MNNPALLVIDAQQGFDNSYWGQRNNSDAETRIAYLIDFWRSHQWPVIHIQHCSTEKGSPLHPDNPGNAFKPEAMPVNGEQVFQKTVNSAFIGTGLESYLRSEQIDKLVVAGLTTDHCVSTSVRMAGNMGFDVILVSDATATFDRQDINGNHIPADEIHRIHLASLSGEFCQVQSTSEVCIPDQ